MPTPDDISGGITDAAKIIMRNEGDTPSAGGEVTWSGSAFQMQDALGVFDPRGITEAQHKALRDLIHFIDQGPADGFLSGAYKEITYAGPLIATETWYEDNTKAQKIVDLSVTYTGVFPTSEVWKMYDADGTTVLVTLTDSIVYSGPFEQTRTRTWA